MSQYPYQPPNPYDPNLGYAMPGTSQPSRRPTSVTALAITGIILASLWLLCNVIGIGTNAITMSNGGHNPMAPQLPPMDPLVVKWGIGQSVVGLFYSAAMLGGCIGALYLRPFARITMIVWSWLALVWTVVITIAQIAWILPATQALMQQMQPNNPAAGIMGSLGAPIAVLTAILYSIVPVLILILWSRPRVKSAFTPLQP